MGKILIYTLIILLATEVIADDMDEEYIYYEEYNQYDKIEAFGYIGGNLTHQFIAPKNSKDISKVQRMFNTISSIPLLVSGSPFSKNIISECSQCIHINNPQEFIEFLKKS